MKTALAIVVLMIAAADTGSASNALPFEAGAAQNDAGPGWRTRTSGDAALKVVDGWLSVDGAADAVAHVERPLGQDNITASARITNFASLYLVWAPGRWCSVGKDAAAMTGRFKTMVAAGGKPEQQMHSASIPWNAYYVRIVLGSDVIRFQFSIDGKEWFTQRLMARPDALSGPPTLLAAGKSYAVDASPFAAKPAGAAVTPGRQTCSIASVSVEQTPAEMLAMTGRERQELQNPSRDPVVVAAARTHGDPTYEQIVKHYPPFRYPRELTGVPEHPAAIGVDWLGRLDSSPGAPVAWFTLGDANEPLGSEDRPLKRRLLDGYIPVVTLATERDSVRYELTVFGASEGFGPDTPLWGHVSLKATALRGGKLPAAVAFTGAAGSRPLEPVRTGKQSWCVYLRYRHPDPATAEPLTAQVFREKLEETARMWRKRIQPAARFDVPDRRVSEAYRAWLAYAMLNSKTVNGYVELHDGSGFYDMVYGYSMSLYAIATDLYGLPELSERLLDTQIHFQSPEGLYTQEAGLPDHGALLLSLAHHYQVTGDRDWLKRVAPAMVKACDWVVRQREAAPKDGVTRGLIKFRPYCDYPGAVFSYFGNTYCCVGLEACAAVLADIESPEAGRLAAESKRYRRDILASMNAAVVEHGGKRMLPIEPDTLRLLKDSNYRGGDYYGLIASCVLETDLLAARDRRALLITDLMEKRGGLLAGVCDFMEGIDHAYTFGYLVNKLRQDDIRPVLLGFWGFLAFGMTRDTYSPVEVSMIETGDNNLTLPHSYSCTMQLRLLRNMLVLEEGDTLWLARAAPEEWLRPGRSIAVNSAPTTLGTVSCRISRLADGIARVSVAPPKNADLKHIKIRLRVPGGPPIAAVTGADSVRFSGDTISVETPSRPLDLTVRFGAAPR